MIKILKNLSMQRRYWATLILVGTVLEAAALYYQYAQDEWPCVLCIHVRIWVLAFILLGTAAMFCTRSPMLMRIMHTLNVIIMAALVERSWQVLAVERGWIFGNCEMELGMPAWFALDKWMPLLFEVQTSCGYSPLLLFNITMAEVLLLFSVLLLIISGTLCFANWRD